MNILHAPTIKWVMDERKELTIKRTIKTRNDELFVIEAIGEFDFQFGDEITIKVKKARNNDNTPRS